MQQLALATARPIRDEQHHDPMVPTIFHEDWWLNALTGGDYDEVTVRAGNRMVGRLPFVIRRRIGGRVICEMPALTHFLGPAIEAAEGSACNRALKQAQIIRELLLQLPRTGAFRQRLHGGIQDTMAFQENGYAAAADFTFELHPAPETLLWKAMRDKTRNMIRRARTLYTVVPVDDPGQFADLYEANVQSKGGRFYYAKPEIRRLIAESLARGCGRAIAARAEDGSIAAAIFCVWDQRSAYYLLSTRLQHSDNSAVSLLLWDAITHAAARGLIFDFDGVSSQGNRVFFTGFGGCIRPRYVVTRQTPYYRAADLAVQACRRVLRI